MEKVSYRGWKNCIRIANEAVEMIVTADVGPRIIRFGFVGGENVFKEYADMLGRTGDTEWLIYGGHRLWHAPEVKPRTYFPDNAPVDVEDRQGYVRFTPPLETACGIQKQIDIALDAANASAAIVHRITNQNQWAVQLAPWALSVMAQGGKVIIPAPPRGSHEDHLLPTHTLTLWAYTNFADPRWTLGEKYMLLEQDSSCTKPQKVGASVPDGWAAYANGGTLFLKTFIHDCCATYPDWGCSVETFTNDEMIELETVGPMITLQPGASVEHVESWHLFKDVPVPVDDADVDKNVLPRVKEAVGQDE
jgi:hypothetical protein